MPLPPPALILRAMRSGRTRLWISSMVVTSMSTSSPRTRRAWQSMARLFKTAMEFDGTSERIHWIG